MHHTEPSGTRRPRPGGICADDVEALERTLDGVAYPADKWQLISHVEQDHGHLARTRSRAVAVLWALPTGRYEDLPRVLRAVARTARGHPRRPERDTVRDQVMGRRHRPDHRQYWESS